MDEIGSFLSKSVGPIQSGSGGRWFRLEGTSFDEQENIAADVEDYEVRRLWTLLNALEENSVRAKEDLGKFRAELDRIVVASSVATQDAAASLWAR